MNTLGVKIRNEMADGFEGVLDHIKWLDRVPFNIKREAAEVAAQEAYEWLRKEWFAK